MFCNILCSTAVQIIPASVQPATPTTIKVINSSAKAAKVQRAPRISGEDRSSPGNRTGIVSIIFTCQCTEHWPINMNYSLVKHIFVAPNVRFVGVPVVWREPWVQKSMASTGSPWQVGQLTQAPCQHDAAVFPILQQIKWINFPIT